MKARIPSSAMLVYLRGNHLRGPERTFQGVLDQATLIAGRVEVTADFPRLDCPVLPIGSETPVGFSGPYLREAIWATGQVVYRREEQFRHRYKLRFEEGAQPQLQPIVNCRRAPRVRPDPSRPWPVGVRALDSETPIQAQMHDISATGISILVPHAGEARLYGASTVEIAFRLPGLEGIVQVIANVCYRRLAGEHVFYGLDFDPSNTPSFEAKHARINAFVNSGLGSRQTVPSV